MYRYNMPTAVNVVINLSFIVGWIWFFAHCIIGSIKYWLL